VQNRYRRSGKLVEAPAIPPTRTSRGNATLDASEQSHNALRMGRKLDEKELRAAIDPVVARLAVAFDSLSDLADSLEDPEGSLRPLEVYKLVRAHIRLVAKNVETLQDAYTSTGSAQSLDGHVALEATLSIELLSSQLVAVEMIAAAMVMLRATEGEDQAFLRVAVNDGASFYDALSQMHDAVRSATGSDILAVYKTWKDSEPGSRAEFQRMADTVRDQWDRLQAVEKSEG
jgi:hypothetical protein